MDKRQLTDEQFSELVDFLYRWGLKSQELLSEMADHYSEKALDRMELGYSWERVLKSFKTKDTYHHLRKLQSNHEKLYNKQWWRYALKELVYVIKSPLTMLLVVVSVFLLHLAITNNVTGPFVPEVIALKALVVLGVAVYFGKYHKTTKHSMLLKSGRYYNLVIFDFVFLHIFITQFVLGSDESAWESVVYNPAQAWFLTIFVGITVLFDIVIIRFIKQAKRSSEKVYPEVFERLNNGSSLKQIHRQ